MLLRVEGIATWGSLQVGTGLACHTTIDQPLQSIHPVVDRRTSSRRFIRRTSKSFEVTLDDARLRGGRVLEKSLGERRAYAIAYRSIDSGF